MYVRSVAVLQEICLLSLKKIIFHTYIYYQTVTGFYYNNNRQLTSVMIYICECGIVATHAFSKTVFNKRAGHIIWQF